MSLIEQLTWRLIGKLFFIGFSAAILLSSGVGGMHGLAQTNPGWSDPTNLSKSGFADTPNIVIDSNGIYHVIWQDEFAGIVYVTGDGVDVQRMLPATGGTLTRSWVNIQFPDW